jgi:hypothetical protein
MDEQWLASCELCRYPGRDFAQKLINALLNEPLYEQEPFLYTAAIKVDGESLQVHVVDDPDGDLPFALELLQESAQDGYVGLDFEWRPDSRPGQDNPIALIQLATVSRCLLLQTSGWHGLPAELLSFFGQVTPPWAAQLLYA